MRRCVLAEADHGRPRDDRWRTAEADTGEVFAQDAQSGDRAGCYKGRLSRASGRRKDDRLTVHHRYMEPLSLSPAQIGQIHRGMDVVSVTGSE